METKQTAKGIILAVAMGLSVLVAALPTAEAFEYWPAGKYQEGTVVNTATGKIFDVTRGYPVPTGNSAAPGAAGAVAGGFVDIKDWEAGEGSNTVTCETLTSERYGYDAAHCTECPGGWGVFCFELHAHVLGSQTVALNYQFVSWQYQDGICQETIQEGEVRRYEPGSTFTALDDVGVVDGFMSSCYGPTGQFDGTLTLIVMIEGQRYASWTAHQTGPGSDGDETRVSTGLGQCVWVSEADPVDDWGSEGCSDSPGATSPIVDRTSCSTWDCPEYLYPGVKCVGDDGYAYYRYTVDYLSTGQASPPPPVCGVQS